MGKWCLKWLIQFISWIAGPTRIRCVILPVGMDTEDETCVQHFPAIVNRMITTGETSSNSNISKSNPWV